MRTLLVLNDPPYGTERRYNVLRHAAAFFRADPSNTVTIFLKADAVPHAKQGQKTRHGYYNLERMVKRFTTGNHRLLLCGTCADARGLSEAEMIAGATRSPMVEMLSRRPPPIRL